ncbi:MAG: NCS2 family permease [Snowella sp.]|jgi:AGZA family xanthine/uracil permease-like MFS transporter|nr:NCS2 family permease [Snowella sp.]
MSNEINLEMVEASQSPPPPYSGWQAKIANYFEFEFYKTNFRTEILAGLTTFMTMAYILIVNPLILSDAIFLEQPKDLFPELVIATGVSAAIGTLVMSLYAKYPFATMPGMGLNAYFAYSVVIGLGFSWRLALAAVLVEGLIFIAMTVTDIRRHLIVAIPSSIKIATTAGIGLFIAYIGLAGDPKVGGAGLIVANPATKTAFGSFRQWPTIMAFLGILIASAFIVRRIKGALLWGIMATALLGWIVGAASWPKGFIQIPPLPVHLFGEAIRGVSGINSTNWVDFVSVLLVFLFVDIFDTIGTLSGLASQAGYLDEKGQIPRANEVLMADAIATTAGAVMGSSTVTTSVESASGIAEGGRTGFSSFIVAILFIFAMFFIPIFEAIPSFATTPALVITGVLMVSSVTGIRWGDMGEAIPAFLTIFLIPLSYSIAAGLSVGMITYPIIKSMQGKSHEVPVVTWALAGVFVARIIFMTIRFG